MAASHQSFAQVTVAELEPFANAVTYSATDIDDAVSVPIGDEQHTPSRADSPFPCHSSLNCKIYLSVRPIWQLATDCIVNPTNETLSDQTPPANSIIENAGENLKKQILNLQLANAVSTDANGESENWIIRTGDCFCTDAYNLCCKKIIHTVGPRYSVRYKTAAENALHSCVRGALQNCAECNFRSIAIPSISSPARRNYPTHDSAHITIRTVRRFLEHFPDLIDAVVFVLDDEAELKIWSSVCALYFPRNKDEELRSRSMLPDDVGNEWGEPILLDRKIRISSSVGVSPGAAVSESRFPMPTLRSRQVAGAPAAPVAQLVDTKALRGFSTVRGDVDVQKPSVPTESSLYSTVLNRSRKHAPYRDLEDMRFLVPSGVDKEGRPVVVFTAALFRPEEIDLERVRLYFVHTLDSIVEKDYVMVVLQAGVTAANKVPFSFLRNTYKVLSRKYKKNLKALYIVQPTGWTRFVLSFAKPFVSSKVWKKVFKLADVEDLWRSGFMEREQVTIPKFLMVQSDVYQH
eukprot:ANDGO_03033.mRNA.1 Protein GDAP2 homolog